MYNIGMIDNTLQSIETITGQLKGIDSFRKIITLLLYAAYLIYRIVVGGGYLALNIVLLVLTTAYACFFAFYLSTDKKAFSQKTVKVITDVYRWTKLVFAGIGVGLSVSGFLAVSGEMSTQNLIFCILLPIFWVLQLVFDILFDYANYCFNLLKKGFSADIDNLKKTYEKPLQTVEGVRNTMEGFRTLKDGFSTVGQAIFKRKKKSPVPPVEDIACTDVIDVPSTNDDENR